MSRSITWFAGQPHDQGSDICAAHGTRQRSATKLQLPSPMSICHSSSPFLPDRRVRQWDGEFARFRRRLGTRPGPRRA